MRLDRFYTHVHSRLNIKKLAYFIHGYSVGSYHSLVQVELCIGSKETQKSALKWNVAYLKGEVADRLRKNWEGFLKETLFFHKLFGTPFGFNLQIQDIDQFLYK